MNGPVAERTALDGSPDESCASLSRPGHGEPRLGPATGDPTAWLKRVVASAPVDTGASRGERNLGLGERTRAAREADLELVGDALRSGGIVNWSEIGRAALRNRVGSAGAGETSLAWLTRVRDAIALGKYRDRTIDLIRQHGRGVAVPEGGGRPHPTGERLGPWVRCPEAEHCWLRAREGGDPATETDRRVFVEKTPRVFDPSLGLPIENGWAWVEGAKGRADDGEGPDEDSRTWADAFARWLGYVLPEDGA